MSVRRTCGTVGRAGVSTRCFRARTTDLSTASARSARPVRCKPWTYLKCTRFRFFPAPSSLSGTSELFTRERLSTVFRFFAGCGGGGYAWACWTSASVDAARSTAGAFAAVAEGAEADMVALLGGASRVLLDPSLLLPVRVLLSLSVPRSSQIAPSRALSSFALVFATRRGSWRRADRMIT